MTYWGHRDARFSGCDTALCHMKRQHENVRTLNAGQAMPRAEYLVDLQIHSPIAIAAKPVNWVMSECRNRSKLERLVTLRTTSNAPLLTGTWHAVARIGSSQPLNQIHLPSERKVGTTLAPGHLHRVSTGTNQAILKVSRDAALLLHYICSCNDQRSLLIHVGWSGVGVMRWRSEGNIDSCMASVTIPVNVVTEHCQRPFHDER